MTTRTENASTFRIVAGVTAVLLLAAAALVYLQGGPGGAPGRSADWQALESQAAAAQAKRQAVEAANAAANSIAADAETILEGSNALLDRSGATTVLQEFQRRADRIRNAASAVPNAEDGLASRAA